MICPSVKYPSIPTKKSNEVRPRHSRSSLTFHGPFIYSVLIIIHIAHISTRDNVIVNRLNKTKVEREVDHEAERQERLRVEGRKKKTEAIERVSQTSVGWK